MGSTYRVLLQFSIATVLPAIVTGCLSLLERRGSFDKWNYWYRQLFFGIVFGLVAIFGTEFGIKMLDATMNVRDAAPVAAGLLFGGPAGIVAGLMGGVERWFAAEWGRGMFTRLACSVATACSGFYAALARRHLFERKRPQVQQAAVVGITAEVLHLLLIFLTNMQEPVRAFKVVRACSWPMVGCNAIAVALATMAYAVAYGEHVDLGQSKPPITRKIQNGLLAVVSACLAVTVTFTSSLQGAIAESQAKNTLTLAASDAEGDLHQATRYADGMRECALLAVGSRHVGYDGMVAIYTTDGEFLATRSTSGMNASDKEVLWRATSGISERALGSVTISTGDYYLLWKGARGVRLVALLPFSEAELAGQIAVLLAAFMEELVLAALFAGVYLLVRFSVVADVENTNDTLALITGGDLDQRVEVRDSAEFDMLSDGINATVGSLKDAIAAEAARIDRDLATARAIQEGALPRTFPPFPEIPDFDLYASMNAAREVGGDFYDFFLVGEHTLCFVVADVSGKGIPASLFMMAAKTEIANNVSAGMPLAEAIGTANWHLCQSNDAGMFVTVWAGMLDWETGELTYVNAGHNPPLLRHMGKWRWLRKKSGLFLGAFDTAKYRSSTIMLSPGDQIFVYTDGVNEAFSAAGEQYGDERLEAFLAAHANLHPRALADAMGAELRAWEKDAEQSDDITMLALEYGVPPVAKGSLTLPATLDHLDEVYELLHTELADRRCPISVQHQIDIALEELFVNICNYAYEGELQPGKVRVEYLYNAKPNSLIVSLTDWGIPFDPLAKEDPVAPSSVAEAKIGGLGILMVKRLADDVSYLRDGDANVIAFRKNW